MSEQQIQPSAEVPMSKATIKLHASLIRHAKGMISAWEEWVRAKMEQKIEHDPDPVKHFSQHK